MEGILSQSPIVLGTRGVLIFWPKSVPLTVFENGPAADFKICDNFPLPVGKPEPDSRLLIEVGGS